MPMDDMGLFTSWVGLLLLLIMIILLIGTNAALLYAIVRHLRRRSTRKMKGP